MPGYTLINCATDCSNNWYCNVTYSPEIAPCNFQLFTTLKGELKGCHFSSDELRVATIMMLQYVSSEGFQYTVNKRVKLCKKCVLVQEESTPNEASATRQQR
jgi:hypothetical protein